ncbi:MAG TPA: PilW family protein [Tahibacter sp.]|nr:PilW family protein [Tahibacter sp.]
MNAIRIEFRRRARGFSLIEVMVAMALGLLVSIGLIAVFNTTGKINRVQEALARLQENGRYATTRISETARSAGTQYCNTTSGYSTKTVGNGPQYPARTPFVFSTLVATTDTFADSNNAIPAPPAGWVADTAYPLSPRYFLQGYECTASTCTPAGTAGPGRKGLPAAGTTAGSRVPGTDVLTMRFQGGTGWSATCALAGTTPTVLARPATGDDTLNFQNGDLALYSDCNSSQIMKVNAAGTLLTATSLLPNGANRCPTGGTARGDTRVFNFSRDFRTVTYYLGLKADTNPDAPTGRVISSLYRRVNGGEPEELVEGVERLDFLYGFEHANGTVRMLTADQVEAQSNATNCPPKAPDLTALEPGCLWRAVTSIEVHMLVNSVRDQYDLSSVDTAFRYSIGDPWFGSAPTASPAATANMPVTGLKAGRMMRREFVATISVRNFSL